jgi:pantoate--beta-alanine ligase
MELTLTHPMHERAGVKIARGKHELREAVSQARASGASIGLVPTMGALHSGHLALLRTARAETGFVVMSLFVNPSQFAPGEDFDRYPRDEKHDLELAAEAGVDLVYAPSVDEVYPDGFASAVEVSGITEVLCGDPARRGPEHFRGVTTVVAKLLNSVAPDAAYFGQKDAQQLAVIRRMVRDLDFPVRVVAVPTVREPDGLALSSRNAYLGPEDRARATALQRALQAVEDAAQRGPLSEALEAGRRELAAEGIEPEYLEVRDPDTLEPIEALDARPALVAVAARVGGARLIDNLILNPGLESAHGETEAHT